jgi:RNA-directed DNA polymerase
MQESYREGLASRPDPESCVGGREAAGEALTGAHPGQPSSCVINTFGVPTPLSEAEGNTERDASGESRADSAQSKTLSMGGNSSHGNREIPTTPVADGGTGRPAQVQNRTAGMHVVGKSDDCIVPGKSPNKDMRSAEAMEGRRSTKGNTLQSAASWTQSQKDGLTGLQRVRAAAYL